MSNDYDRRREQLRLEEEERRAAVVNRNASLVRVVQIIYYLVGALGLLLIIRVLLRLFNANTENIFAQIIYGLSNPFVAPFSTLFPTPGLGESSIFEINALIAIAAYSILAWLLVRLIWLVGSRSR
ncbi:MAG: YggT family protein [Spirulinaceae cyanobacterium]